MEKKNKRAGLPMLSDDDGDNNLNIVHFGPLSIGQLYQEEHHSWKMPSHAHEKRGSLSTSVERKAEAPIALVSVENVNHTTIQSCGPISYIVLHSGQVTKSSNNNDSQFTIDFLPFIVPRALIIDKNESKSGHIFVYLMMHNKEDKEVPPAQSVPVRACCFAQTSLSAFTTNGKQTQVMDTQVFPATTQRSGIDRVQFALRSDSSHFVSDKLHCAFICKATVALGQRDYIHPGNFKTKLVVKIIGAESVSSD